MANNLPLADPELMRDKLNLEGTFGGGMTEEDILNNQSIYGSAGLGNTTTPKPNTESPTKGPYKAGGSYSPIFPNRFPTPTVTPTIPPAEIPVDTTVEDSYKSAMEAANDRLKQAYEYQQSLLAKAKDNAMREAYIKQKMVEKAYPEQLAAAGINGGAAQALIARNNADYANQRTTAQGNYMNGLAEAGHNYQQGVLENNQNFLENMAAYRQGLDEMRRKWELEMLSNSGLLNLQNKNNYGSGIASVFGNPQMTAQEYLNNLRQIYGNLFK